MEHSAAAGAEAYATALEEYLRERGEAALYKASLLSREFVQERVGPEEIVAVHVGAMERATAQMSPRELAHAATDGLHFLLEVMIAYGVQHQEYLDLRLKELARSDADRSEILAVIAHELRTPITAAKGSLDLARRSLARGEIERLRPLLGHSIDAVARLTGDLIDASRGTAPQLDRSVQDLRALVAQAIDWSAEPTAAKGVVLVHEEPDRDARVVGDADAILSIAGNLLSNAIRYTPSG